MTTRLIHSRFHPRTRSAVRFRAPLLFAGCLVAVTFPEGWVPGSARAAAEIIGQATQDEPESAAAVRDPGIEESERRGSEEARSLEGRGETVWAAGFEGELVRGVDGELYPAYNFWTIEHVQTLLARRGLYGGPVNGVLDMPTMSAIAAFQQATQALQVCGVPTPRTRLFLEQGSHTV